MNSMISFLVFMSQLNHIFQAHNIDHVLKNIFLILRKCKRKCYLEFNFLNKNVWKCMNLGRNWNKAFISFCPTLGNIHHTFIYFTDISVLWGKIVSNEIVALNTKLISLITFVITNLMIVKYIRHNMKYDLKLVLCFILLL